ncbi:MAG: AlpA family phage regulatory protein [Alcaligenaceae bacterium]|nr:MAG: AlpA family phage regulatory protein [Alcaligenaceae bacterium]
MPEPANRKSLRLKAVLEKIQVSRSTVYLWMNKSSPYFDPTFPLPFKLGRSLIAWDCEEVDAWLLTRMRSRQPVEAKGL